MNQDEIMNESDPALNFSHPRLLAAIYFGLLSIVFTVLIDELLITMGVEEVIPLSQAVLLGLLIATGTGAVFGESIIHCVRPYKSKTFWLGFAMVMASIPVFTLGLVLLMRWENVSVFALTDLQDMIHFYLFALAYCYIVFGIILAIAAGFAAIYLRGRLVYDVIHIQNRHQRAVNQNISKR